MKWITIILTALSLQIASSVHSKEIDLTQFDQPFLLGDWYLLNPDPTNSEEDFIAVKLSLDSTYNFTIDIQKKDFSVDHWEGFYHASEDTIILGSNSSDPQIYEYDLNHNALQLNGVIFRKALSNELAGSWSSHQLRGDDMAASDIHQMELTLRPDFVFDFKVINDAGLERAHQGVYITEGEQLILLYKDGEQSTRYTLDSDELTLKGEDGSTFAVLSRNQITNQR
ncbi:hypothetical protein [Vibrio astriarenae]|uniref:hypothetical protein n=1 Tax=Vibrio astriarenae TaxID=1481923 RepID=UPI003735F3A8